ncbi:hypothetical protein WBW50_26015, partial [Escherichia marmotae]|uniref:hypothetical protein n=1 Tax=Escherichia marmotae TaxID=1499973 RepID=UPI003D175E65
HHYIYSKEDAHNQPATALPGRLSSATQNKAEPDYLTDNNLLHIPHQDLICLIAYSPLSTLSEHLIRNN